MQELKSMRESIGMSQAAFAKKFDIPLNTYFHWEQGKHKPPKYVVGMISTILKYEKNSAFMQYVEVFPYDVKRILTVLMQNGFEGYVVGGAVRDLLLGVKPHDWDITTNATPEQIKGLFRKTIDTGLKHGTVTIMLNGEGYEVTTYRKDGDYSDGRHPDAIEYAKTIEEDLARRDFTINAMALSLDGWLVDPYYGEKDLKEKRLACVGNPEDRFTEDALRMLRAARFLGKLGFKCDQSIFDAIAVHKAKIKNVSKERIHEELTKLLQSEYVEVGIRLLVYTKLLKEVSEDMAKMFDCVQNQPAHYTTVGWHTVDVVKALPQSDKVLRWAAFLHDIGKPNSKGVNEKTGYDTFYGHPEESVRIAKVLLEDLRFSNKEQKEILDLVANHDVVYSKLKDIRYFVATYDKRFIDRLYLLKDADLNAHNTEVITEHIENSKRFMAACYQVLEDGTAITKADLCIDGNDLIKAGMHGKKIGEYLESLWRECIAHPDKNDRALILERLRKREEKVQSKKENKGGSDK